jgi:23S rRNA (pseudouridine1915-N3)-methyltransferase
LAGLPPPPEGKPGNAAAHLARGRIARSPEGEMVERYLKRIAWPVKHTELPDAAARSLRWPRPRGRCCWTSAGRWARKSFAALLGRWRDDGVRECALPDRRGRWPWRGAREADLLIAFGAMTWPHLMARAMLAEQLWRATSILAGHPYHRAG